MVTYQLVINSQHQIQVLKLAYLFWLEKIGLRGKTGRTEERNSIYVFLLLSNKIIDPINLVLLEQRHRFFVLPRSVEIL